MACLLFGVSSSRYSTPPRAETGPWGMIENRRKRHGPGGSPGALTADGVALMSDAHRLPRTVLPSRYEIRLEPDLTAFTFSGAETVTVTVTEPTAEIVLN